MESAHQSWFLTKNTHKLNTNSTQMALQVYMIINNITCRPGLIMPSLNNKQSHDFVTASNSPRDNIIILAY